MKKKARTFRFDASVFEWFDRNDIKMQGVITRLVDSYIQTKETEQQKIENYNNLKHE
jgi:hypothetical protein